MKAAHHNWNNQRGQIPVFWTPDDYINSGWYRHQNNMGGFSCDQATLEIYDHLVGVMIPGSVHEKFFQLNDFFYLQDPVLDLSLYHPGMILPWHHDTYPTYMSRRGLTDADRIVRIIVFLHDPAPGHQLWIGDIFCAGNAGSWFSWQGHQMHMAANLGQQDRYVAQITGHL